MTEWLRTLARRGSQTLDVGEGKTFATILEAMAKADDGAVIRVWPGIYHERLRINRSLTIQGHGRAAEIVVAPTRSSEPADGRRIR